MKSNFNSVFKKFSFKIFQFAKIRIFLDNETRVLVYKQTVLPLTECVSYVMSLNNKHDVDKLQKFQNRAVRMCYNVQDPRDVTIIRLHEMACIDLLHKRRMMLMLAIFYDNRLKFSQNVDRLHVTRQAVKNNVEIKRANTNLYSKSPFCVGGKFWNSLPKHVQDLNTKEQFKLAIADLV